MNNRYLMSVAAAALIAGTGFANAQGTGMNREAPSSGAATSQQSAPPSERGSAATPMNRESSQSGAPAEAPKSAQSKDMDHNATKNQRAQDDMKAGAKGEKSAQDNNMKGERSKSMSSENEKAGASKDMKADSKSGADSKTGTTNAQTGTETRSQTTGNAATSATAAPPAEKRSQIVSAIKSEKIQETTNVNFNISVGATVPASVHFYPLPPRIVEIYPEWRGYEVILVHGRYVIVRPQTREIVYIIES